MRWLPLRRVCPAAECYSRTPLAVGPGKLEYLLMVLRGAVPSNTQDTTPRDQAHPLLRVDPNPSLTQTLIQPVLFQKARKLLLRRSKPYLIIYPKISKLLTKIHHLFKPRMLWGEEPLLEI